MNTRFDPIRCVRLLARTAQISAALILCSCLGNSGSPTAPPTGIRTYSGDSLVSITWDDDPVINYWVFHAQDPTLDIGNQDWTSLLGAGAVENTGSPVVLCGQVNNPSPTGYFPAIFFSINARTGSAPGGNGSALVSAVPRPAGGPQAPWILGGAIPSSVNGLAYGPVTSCGYSGRPPSGIYVAVGPNGSIFYDQNTPNVAGPLTQSNGNVGMTWIQANTPAGFSQQLNAVSGFATGVANPAAPNIVFVAVGENGAILRSVDGKNWAQVANVPTGNNLNAVSTNGGGFIVVGDSATVLTSPDGLNWSLSGTSTQATNENLTAVHCAGSTCVAVGPNGTTLWSFRSGADWALVSYGTNTWSSVAYGNNDLNSNAIITDPNGVLTVASPSINTWVISDAQGNYAYAPVSEIWESGSTPIASSIVAIDYTTQFIAIDGAGNAYASENGAQWQPVGTTGVTNPIAVVSNGVGFVALGSDGSNASSF